MTTTALPSVVYDMPAETYHAHPALSSTGARRILDNPARFRWDQDHPPRPTLAMQVGTAVHTKVLGVGDAVVTYPDEHLTPSGSVSTKAATVAWEAEQTAAGRIVLNRWDMARVEAMTAAVFAHPAARSLIEAAGASEVSVFSHDPDTGVQVRARFDRLTELAGSDPFAVDLKTTAGRASMSGFGRDAAKYGYPIQEAHYLDTLEWATGQRPPMRFIVVEKQPPHFVAVHEFDELTRMAARDLAAKARETFATCLAANDWPAYGDDVLTTQVPGWWFDQAEDIDEMELA